MKLNLGIVSLSAALLTALSHTPPSGAAEQLVLLRNGHILKGTALQVGDRYRVQIGGDNASEVVLHARDVEFVGESLEEAFRYKRDLLHPRDLSGRVVLIDWCLRHNLRSQAAEQIAVARAIEPGNRRVLALERRLQAAEEAPPAAAAAAPPTASPNVLSMDDVLDGLPETSLERFANHVQPFLLTRCAGVSCHGVGSRSTYRLIQPRYGESLPSRIMRRNAFETLSHVNREQPAASRLLTVPSQPHGSAGQALVLLNDANYERILTWIQMLTRKERDARPASPISAADPFVPPLPVVGMMQRDPVTPRSPPAPSPAPSADPFDPEAFNRMR